jgi:hypothetical protein
MSETMNTAEAQQDVREREGEPKDENRDDYEQYCCTPPDGNGGPDTKP